MKETHRPVNVNHQSKASTIGSANQQRQSTVYHKLKEGGGDSMKKAQTQDFDGDDVGEGH